MPSRNSKRPLRADHASLGWSSFWRGALVNISSKKGLVPLLYSKHFIRWWASREHLKHCDTLYQIIWEVGKKFRAIAWDRGQDWISVHQGLWKRGHARDTQVPYQNLSSISKLVDIDSKAERLIQSLQVWVEPQQHLWRVGPRCVWGLDRLSLRSFKTP